jgi:hypothetical protein
MRTDRPNLVAIEPDDYHAEHVGRTADGRQFFLTTPFESLMGSAPGNEFVALYLFDSEGKLVEAMIDAFGPRASMDKDARNAVYAKRLEDLQPFSIERIEVAPFSVERFGTTFGLVVREPEDDYGPWAVEVQPGSYMAFFAPWDSGEYDT